MATHTLEQLVNGGKDGDEGEPPDNNTIVSVKGYPINPMGNSFLLVDTKPGEKPNHIVLCKFKKNELDGAKEQILMYGNLSNYEATKGLVKDA